MIRKRFVQELMRKMAVSASRKKCKNKQRVQLQLALCLQVVKDLQVEVKEGMESDEEIRRVPEIGGEVSTAPAAGREAGSVVGQNRVQPSGEGGQRKTGRSPADKENKRLKRLLRNRVSAQQARERKKAYLNELESRVNDLEKKNSELEERLSTLQNENQMLRQIVKNTTASRRGGNDSSNAAAD